MIKAIVFDAYGTLYDIESLSSVTDDAFPGHGEAVTQIWRLKQLEYSWLRSLMGRYEDFASVTRDSLAYTLRVLGLECEAGVFENILEKYVRLELYPGVEDTLLSMRDKQLAILSNGSPDMLNNLVRNTGLDRVLDAVISIDGQRIYKPSPEAYAIIESSLAIKPSEVMFVSSNPFDVCGAKSFGMNVTWIERVTGDAMARDWVGGDVATPGKMFKALRSHMDELGFSPDYRIPTLGDLPNVVAASDRQSKS